MVPVDYRFPLAQVINQYIFRDGKVGRQGKLLVNDGYSRVAPVLCAVDFLFFPVYPDFPMITRIRACEYFHKGRFSRPVFPHQRVDLAAVRTEIHVFQGGDPAKTFAYISHFNFMRICHICTSLFILFSAILICGI
ncbi:MAG: hypothetical protein DELT_03171 [Desulfovibrio sp.]